MITSFKDKGTEDGTGNNNSVDQPDKKLAEAAAAAAAAAIQAEEDAKKKLEPQKKWESAGAMELSYRYSNYKQKQIGAISGADYTTVSLSKAHP